MESEIRKMKYQIPTEVLKLNPRVFKYDINGEIVYVKKREKNKKHFGHILQSIIYNTHYRVRKPRAASLELLKRMFLATDVVVSINDEYIELTGFWVEELERKVVTVPRYGLRVEEWICLRGYYVR